MIGLIFVLVLVVLVVRWRIRHVGRRRVELGAAQAARRPLSDFDARFPADRRQGRASRRRRGARWGF